MKTIEYSFNKENHINVLSIVLEDWNLNKFELNANKKLNLLLYIEEKSKMVHSVLENKDDSGSDTKLYTDICLQPQNLLYNDMGFKNSMSFTITMNDAKAFVADVAFTLLTVQGNIAKIQIIIVRLLILIIQHAEIINDNIEKCVIKSIIILSQKGIVTKQKIIEYLTNNKLCPNILKGCENYAAKNGHCLVTENSINLFIKYIDSALYNLIEEGVIVSTTAEKSDEQRYRISNFLDN